MGCIYMDDPNGFIHMVHYGAVHPELCLPKGFFLHLMPTVATIHSLLASTLRLRTRSVPPPRLRQSSPPPSSSQPLGWRHWPCPDRGDRSGVELKSRVLKRGEAPCDVNSWEKDLNRNPTSVLGRACARSSTLYTQRHTPRLHRLLDTQA